MILLVVYALIFGTLLDWKQKSRGFYLGGSLMTGILSFLFILGYCLGGIPDFPKNWSLFDAALSALLTFIYLSRWRSWKKRKEAQQDIEG